jgi:manganese/zinc/iron transport system permease protein
MVLAAAGLFVLALFFAPRHGIATRWWRGRSRVARIGRENTLKAIYQVLEDGEFKSEAAGFGAVADRRRTTLSEVRREVQALVQAGLATVSGGEVTFTPEGWQRACEIVRNHRLWELYLTNAVQVAPDHVHDDAEVIEHVLGEETVRRLERRLNYARRDPHGKLIPGAGDMGEAPRGMARAAGFGKEGR